MTTSASTIAPIHEVQLRRFTEQPCFYRLWDLSSSLCGSIAVSGYHCNTKRTFIELYWGGNSNSRDNLRSYFSKNFEKYSNHYYRYCSFLGNEWNKIVTCIGENIQIIDAKNEAKVLSRSRKDKISCLTVSEGQIFLGLKGSKTLIVLNEDLVEIKKVVLIGIKDGDFPCALQVSQHTVCVLTRTGMVLSVQGSDETEYTDSTRTYSHAESITMSAELDLVAILWGYDRIIAYPLNENKPVLVFHVDYNVSRIRISDFDRLLIMADFWTGKIKMYDLQMLFTYERMKEQLCQELEEEECKMLANVLGLTKDHSHSILRSQTPSKRLLNILEENGIVNRFDVSSLANVLDTISPPCYNVVRFYQKIQQLYKTESAKPEMIERLMAKVEEMYALETSDQSFEELSSDYNERIDLLQEHLQESKRREEFLEKENIKSTNMITKLERDLFLANQNILERDSALSELHKYQLKSTREIRELKEYLSQLKDSMVQLKQGAAETATEDDFSSIRLKDTTYPALSAEFGKLVVGVADSLTLDHSLKLSLLFNLPPSFSDMLYRISPSQSPGLKFLKEIKERNIINMYDTTNLQKAFKMLELDKVNHEVVTPYQEKIDDEQYALHKAKERFSWTEVNAFVDATQNSKKVSQSNKNLMNASGKRRGEQLKQETQAKPTTNYSGIQEKAPGLSVKDRHRSPYIEHSIGKEGGAIHLADTSLTIPSEALLRTHVIGLSVSNDPYFCLPTKFDKTRMTPLVKLEPLGLTLKKPVQLVIPHFALIPEPERHDVIIYSGLTSANQNQLSDITWTEERSIPRQLKEKSVIVDIQCFSYLSACLVSQPSAPSWHIVRALTFIDGVKSADEDLTLTVCFCSDNESEYNTLLSDYRKKLCLEKYSTLYLPRYSESSGKDNTLNVTVTSVNNTYMPYTDQAASKSIAFPHLCSASRVSQQFRLRKNQTADSDLVDVKLIFSQHDSTEIFLKTKIKDLIVSQESEDRLNDGVPPNLKPYEKLKANVSAMLEERHCRMLATYFELSPAEAESVEDDPSPGTMLITILDQREKIMPQKMIDLFQGLKACHLDKIARKVSEYIDKYAEHSRQESQRTKTKTKGKEIPTDDSLPMYPPKKQQVNLKPNDPTQVAVSSRSDRLQDFTIFSSSGSSDAHAKTLMKEGYPEYDVLEALEVSTNRLVLARKLLSCLNEPLVMQHEKECFLYKEQYIDGKGGEVHLPEGKIRMQIPNGAISRGSIVSIVILMGTHAKIASEGRTLHLTPVIKIGQEGLSLHKPVKITIPHCAAETEGITNTNMYLGFSTEGEDIQWRKRKQQDPKPLLKKDSFEVLAHQFSAISLNVAVNDTRPLCKRMRILPLISRVLNASDGLTITLLVYNDDEAEHLHIVYEQTDVEGKLQLHDFKRFTLKSSEKEKEVHIVSGNKKITPYLNTDTKKILVSTLLQNTRHSLEFHFQNKEQINDLSFKLQFRTRQSMGTSDNLQFDFRITLNELMKKPKGSTRGLLKSQSIQPEMEKSFEDLIRKLGRELGIVSCLEVARIFGLSTVVRGRINNSNEPGHVLVGELVHKQLISTHHVSALDFALTKTGDQQLADAVKEYRKKNAALSTTIFTLF
ncbi:Netrin receptor UNC5B-b [Holothuria leucospilota]|uniref:Netrin receptor UNC5 n=1 Tax=Holothuria leucospilota TaxID=206669 RepID=A0A9Q1BDG5_HOLLE|nr:Netrin receptor UNC5B-b [Holothuria leucospilota]